MPTGTAVLCVLTGGVWTRCSVTPDSFTPSEVIRKAELGDAEALAALSGQLGYPATAALMRERLALILPSADHAVFVAEVQGRVVAWTHVLKVLHLESGLCAEIAGLVVDEAHRSEGLGAELVRRAIDWTRSQGLAVLQVRSRAERLRTHQFYLRLGFAQTKVQHLFELRVPD
ncbi:GNAT family N-acetyltransferase [Thiomonas sp. Sup16B3]|uniref:GNAT family N-acetyltransferase n=1 Tax=Thiomonas sp. Sup16B3 TaxID=2493109 RepID=UPI001E491922|nr:GNAT family N-acetyltransferase [Thiomonas sp. Sup16B3]